MSRQNGYNAAKLAMMLAIFLVTSIAMASDAQAIGVTPGRNTIDFSPGLTKSISFTILNNEHKDFNALVYVEGDLKDYIEIDRALVEFDAGKNSETMTYTVSLPDDIGEPGDHWARIIVMDIPTDIDATEGKTKVIGTTAVVHQLRVKVAYPGKFAKAELKIKEAEPNKPVEFFINVLNVGEQDIQQAWATIDILGPTNERVATVETGRISIKSKNTGELLATWDADVNAGNYHAVATVHYDDKITRAERNFGIGNMLIDVLDVGVRDFRLGGIAKFEIEVESKWSEKIGGVYAEMEILRPNGDVMTSFKSASVDIEPMSRATLFAYWDTEGVERGDYNAILSLHYGGRSSESRISTFVGFDSIETSVEGGVTGRAIGPPAGYDINMYIILLVVVLVGINGFWFMRMRKKKR